MIKHFVTFHFPGAFVGESSVAEVPSWDQRHAIERARQFQSLPLGFQFTTQELKPGEWTPRETAKSPMHFLGGRVRTREEVEQDNRPGEEILRANMRSNNYKRVIKSPCGWTSEMNDGDVVLSVEAK